MSIVERNLIWWRDSPVDVEMGLVSYLSKQWKGTIFIISCNSFAEERTVLNFTDGTFSNVKFIILNSTNKPIVDSILSLDNCIHVFSGFKGRHKDYFLQLVKQNKQRKDFVMLSESPNRLSNGFLDAIKYCRDLLIYKRFYKKYGKHFTSFFAFGDKAVSFFNKVGWKRDVLFPLIYLPKLRACKCKTEANPHLLKGLYIGRFKHSTKGTNILMSAIDQLSVNNIVFDFVGGYGDNKDEVIKWCNESTKANFVGSWGSDEVIAKMAEYDFVVVPSFYDGWNLAPQQSILAGIGCVVSDMAGSNEIIEASKSGVVFKAGDVVALKNILTEISHSNKVIEMWKKNAVGFQNNISIDTVGNYFINSLRFSFGELKNRPVCSWRVK